jgi:hypothetical protein
MRMRGRLDFDFGGDRVISATRHAINSDSRKEFGLDFRSNPTVVQRRHP